jgi:high affinity sulfate transporter 1
MNLAAAFARVPLYQQVRHYQPAWAQRDLAAGLSVAAVSLPSAIAYPAIAQLPVETGLLAAIFALVGYALTGPSPRLMVGPDTATCIMLAGVLTSLGLAAPGDRMVTAQILAVLVGLLCIGARFLRFGMIANFLSRPMLVGFLMGISISLIIGQIKRMTGIAIESDGLVRPLIEFAGKIGQAHLPTVVVGLGSLLCIRMLQRLLPGLPAPLLAIAIAIVLSYLFDFAGRGIAVLGPLPPISFAAKWPGPEEIARIPELLGGAAAIMFVSFGSGIVTARSFAMKQRADVSADRELTGFGGANILSGLFGGFPVTASDSRTAVNFVIGGRTQLTALIAAAGVAVAILLVAAPLALLPTATLGAILISAAIDLIDLQELRAIRRISRAEFVFALITLLGVVIVGVLQGVFIAIAVTLAQLIWTASRPRIALLGKAPGREGLVKLHRYPEAQPIPGMTIIMIQSSMVFFNTDYLKQRLLKLALAREATSWLVIDAAAVNMLDSTAIGMLDELETALAGSGITLCLSDLNSAARNALKRAGLAERLGPDRIFSSAEAAVAAFAARGGFSCA